MIIYGAMINQDIHATCKCQVKTNQRSSKVRHLHLELKKHIKQKIPSLKLTAKAPDNRPKPNGKGLYFNHPFVGANCLLVSDFRKGRIHRIGIFYQLEIYH